MSLKRTLKPFLKTNEGQNIILLDYYGYKIAEKQSEMTIVQEMFISKGRVDLDKKMKEAEEKEIEKIKRKSGRRGRSY